MTVHNAIQRSELNAALKAALGITHSEGVLERFSETLQPTFDLWGRPEFAWLRAEFLFGMIGALPGVAVEFGGSGIVNPINSGGIAIVYATIRSAVNNSWNWGIGLESTVIGTFAQGGAVNGIDGRRVPAGGAINLGAMQLPVQLWQGSDPASVLAIVNDSVTTPAANDQERPFHVPIIIKPGQAAMVVGTVVNTAATPIFWGWFRKAKRGELP